MASNTPSLPSRRDYALAAVKVATRAAILGLYACAPLGLFIYAGVPVPDKDLAAAAVGLGVTGFLLAFVRLWVVPDGVAWVRKRIHRAVHLAATDLAAQSQARAAAEIAQVAQGGALSLPSGAPGEVALAEDPPPLPPLEKLRRDRACVQYMLDTAPGRNVARKLVCAQRLDALDEEIEKLESCSVNETSREGSHCEHS